MHQLYLDVAHEDGHDKFRPVSLVVTRFPFIVGRHADCDRRLDLPFISRHHCRFLLRDGAVWVEDLASHNGTYVNGERIAEARPLRDGDRLAIGHLPFRVRLPEDAVPETAPSTRIADGGQRRILVVEDDPDTAETLAMILRQMGHDVRIAYDGPEALREAKAHQPDTVLLDICLPGMDGYEVARRLREEEAARAARLVGITGRHGPDDTQRSAEAGMERLLTKPVVPDLLEEVVR
jgi:CheY-like chemotaxis protein